MNRKKELIVRDLQGTVENKYTVEWPTIQEMIDIESLKLSLSKDKYASMILTGTKGMNRALNYIDLVSYFSVLCPELIKHNKVDIRSIDAIDINKGLLRVYLEQFLPWWNKFEEEIDKSEELVDDKEGED